MATPDGLKFYNPRNGYLYNYVSDINNIFTIKSKDITCLWQDSGNSIWAGSFDTGLNRLDRAGTIFRAFTYDPKYENSFGPGWADDFAEDRDGNIWISCHENFIDKYKKVKNQFEKVIIDKKARLLAVYNDNDGTMWVSDDKGNIYNRTPDQHSFVKKLNIAADNNYNAVLNIFKDSFGTVWLGTYWYYFSYNETTNKTNYFSFDSLPSSGGSANVRGIFESDRHNLWLCTDDGLFKRNLKTGHVSRVGLSKEKSKAFLDQDINSLYIDQKGILWVGTWRGGLNRYDPATGEVKSYTRQDGLPSNSIQGILGDEEHNALWLSTFIGFSRFDMHSETFQNFDIKDGIQSNLSTDGSALKTSSGDFMFGGSNGFTMFRPDDIKDSKISPRVFLTNFKLSDKKILPGQDSPLKENISDAKQIVLDHDQNDISFDYLGIHFIKPFATQYAYILDHYDENWHNAGSQRTAIYPNLPPGEYTFRVKAANYSNVWSDEASIKVNILYPWWRTNWAYTGYFLLFVMGVFAVDRFQRKRILAKERAASEIKEAKLRAQVAEAENARKTRELEEARQLQLSMLPKQVPQLPHLDIAVYMQTATEVGGDYYDFHVALDGTLTVVIGDATGHGMKAGTMVTTAKSLFRSYAPNPDILLSFREFTRCIKEMNFNKLSMCLTMLKIKDKRLQISSAAMPPAYIYRSNNQTVDEQMFEAMPLGTMDSFPYEMKDTTLQQGDTILLMSDGLPELKNNNGKMYGYKKIREKFAEIAEQTAEDIITFLNDEGAAWINNGSPEDDVTFVVIKLK